jgi:POT family proton-dependent oligopeptide transporter
MGSLLVLYLNSGPLLPGRFDSLYGASTVAALFGTPAGDSNATQALSSQLWGAYVCLAYLTPLAGGMLADAVLGPRATLLCGGCLMALGHGCMMSERLFLVGLALVALGNGLFKPSVSAQARKPSPRVQGVLPGAQPRWPPRLFRKSSSGGEDTFPLKRRPGTFSCPFARRPNHPPACCSQVSDLYPKRDSLRERGFAIFYGGINIGALLAPLACGAISETVSFHAAFGLAAVGMLAGLATYLLGWGHLPTPDGTQSPACLCWGTRAGVIHPPRPAREGAGPTRLSSRQWASLLCLCLLSVPFWAVYAQLGNTLVLVLRDHTSLQLWPSKMLLPVPWVQALNPCVCILLLAPLSGLWARQAARGVEPSPTRKMAIGCALLAAAYLGMGAAAAAAGSGSSARRVSATGGDWPTLAIGADAAGEGGKRSRHATSLRGGRGEWEQPLWVPALGIALFTVGDIYVSPVGLALVSAASQGSSAALGLWFFAGGVGGASAGQLGTLYSRMPVHRFLVLLSGIAACASIAFLLVGPRLHALAAGPGGLDAADVAMADDGEAARLVTGRRSAGRSSLGGRESGAAKRCTVDLDEQHYALKSQT